MSTWELVKKTVKRPQLSADIDADVAIVGGGMCGALAAYTLFKAGHSVVVLEKGEIGTGATMATTAFITEAIDTPYSQVSSLFGPSVAKAVHDSKKRAIDAIEAVIEEEGIACEFIRCPNFVYASDA